MSHKTTPGEGLVQSTVTSAAPVGDAGVLVDQLTFGQGKPDRWMITVHYVDQTTRAELDIDPIGTTDLDTVVEASAAYPGTEGNGITVQAIGDSVAGVTIDEDVGAMSVVIHYQSGVSTVAQVETALATSVLLDVKTPGTAATVLTAPGDNVAPTALAGGANDATTMDAFLWGRDVATKRWGRVDDAYGNVVNGEIFTDMGPGRRHIFSRDVGNFDRLYVSRDGSGGDSCDARFTPLLGLGRGN